jgi:hypothetical protein
MSIFLEDEDLGKDIEQSTDTKPEEINQEEIDNIEKEASEFDDEINEKCRDLKEAVAYQEAAWSNIIISTMQEEYKLIKEEGNVTEAVKNFFKTIREWCKNLFQKIKDSVTKAIDKISMLVAKSASHYKKYGKISDKIDSNNINIPKKYQDEKVLVKQYIIINSKNKEKHVDNLDSIDVICSEIKKWLEDDTTTGEIKTGNIELSYKEILSSPYTLLKNAEYNLEHGITAVNDAKKDINKMSNSLKETDNSAKEGESAKDEETANECKEKVKINKAKTMKYNRELSVLISLSSSAMNQSLKIYNAALQCQCQKKNKKK